MTLKHIIYAHPLNPPDPGTTPHAQPQPFELSLEPIPGARWAWRTPQACGHDDLVGLSLTFPAIIGLCAGLSENLWDDHIAGSVRPWSGAISYVAGGAHEQGVARAMSAATAQILTPTWPGTPMRQRAAELALNIAEDVRSGAARELSACLKALPAALWEDAARRLLNGRPDLSRPAPEGTGKGTHADARRA